jgi:hypothetical protein
MAWDAETFHGALTVVSHEPVPLKEMKPRVFVFEIAGFRNCGVFEMTGCF